MSESFDQPLDKRHRRWRTNLDSERTGIVAERIARFTGTPKFIIWQPCCDDLVALEQSRAGAPAL